MILLLLFFAVVLTLAWARGEIRFRRKAADLEAIWLAEKRKRESEAPDIIYIEDYNGKVVQWREA